MVLASESNNHYKTNDSSLAAYLYCAGYEIHDIDYLSDPNRAFVIFKDNSPGIYDHARLYFTDKAAISPATYSRIYKRLTTIIRRQIPWMEGIINA